MFGMFGPQPKREPSKFDPETLKSSGPVPDLRTQFESLLDAVWRGEATWRLMDRIDQQVANDERRKRKNGGAKETGTQAHEEREREETGEGSADGADLEEGPRD